MSLKLYVIFSAEALKAMGGNRGKMVAQGNHAALHAFWDAEQRFPAAAAEYRASGMATKITLVAPAHVILELVNSYRDRCGVTTVVDKGLTVFDGPTLTAVGIGPIDLGEARMGEEHGDAVKILI